MTVDEAIVRADALRPNTIDYEMKMEWLISFDADQAEMMGAETPSGGANPEEHRLLMPKPHDQIYPLYLCAMIDNAMEETALYANDMAVANQAISEARRWWWRNNDPPKPHRVGVM